MSVSIKRLLATGGSLVLFAAGCLSALPEEVRADDYHYVNILVGDRAADMAGAYTAISDNASGCYYNPAGIVYGAGANLSASVNAFSSSTKRYKGALQEVDAANPSNVIAKHDWTQTSSILLPNYFGSIYNTKYGTFGFSYAVTDATQRKQQQMFRNIKTPASGYKYISEYHININDVDNTYNFGPSYAYKISDNFSFGTTLYGVYRDATVIRNQFVIMTPTAGSDEFELANLYSYKKEFSVKPIIGVMFSPTDKLSIGITAKKQIVVSSEEKFQSTFRGIADWNNTNPYVYPPSVPSFDYDLTDSTNALHGYWTNPNAVDFQKYESSKKRKFGTTGTVGAAYFPTQSLLLSGEMSYTTSPEDGQDPVINAAVGMEYYISDRYAVRGGVYTDRTSSPEIVSGLTNQIEHVDLYGANLSLTRFTRSTSTTLGLGYTRGIGEAQVVPNSLRIQDVEVSNIMAFLSAAYSF